MTAKQTMVSLGGAYTKHPQIKISHTELFHGDGTHLSKLGNDLFLNNLQGAIEHIMGVKIDKNQVMQFYPHWHWSAVSI